MAAPGALLPPHRRGAAHRLMEMTGGSASEKQMARKTEETLEKAEGVGTSAG